MLLHEPLRRSVVVWTYVLATVFALVAGILFHRHADFPYLYHTDEPSKVDQIIRREYNFHHPLLLLRSTEGLLQASGASLEKRTLRDGSPITPQAVVEKGRMASAIFAGLAVGAVVLLASQLAGRVAGVAAGILALTHPVLFELSHYMKEDCGLLVGIMSTLAALAYYAKRPSIGRAILAGLGAGLAVSGKYLGCMVAMGAIVVLALQKTSSVRRWVAVTIAVLAMLASFSAINYPAFFNKDRVAKSFEKELEKVDRRAEERPESIRFKHLSKIGTTLSIPLLIGIGYWFARRWRIRRHEPLIFRALGVIFVVYFLVVSLAPKTKDRYLLPVYIMACALGAAGLGEWRRRHRRDRKAFPRIAAHLAAVVAVGLHLPGLVEGFRAFKCDDRRELADYIRANVPPSGGIAHDVRVMLSRTKAAGLEGFDLPNALYEPPDRYVADLGSIEQLKAKGITHVAVCEADYHNTEKDGEKMRARNRWYADLFEHHRLVWQAKPGEIAYLQPGLRLYELGK